MMVGQEPLGDKLYLNHSTLWSHCWTEPACLSGAKDGPARPVWDLLGIKKKTLFIMENVKQT